MENFIFCAVITNWWDELMNAYFNLTKVKSDKYLIWNIGKFAFTAELCSETQ